MTDSFIVEQWYKIELAQIELQKLNEKENRHVRN